MSVAVAQKVVQVNGQYTYYAPENISLEQAKQVAIERARLEAMAAVFGTEVSQTNMSTISNSADGTETKFRSLGGTEVKGEWIEDTKSPEIEIRYEASMLIVTAKVSGKARKSTKTDIELQIDILRNGVESSVFRNNDRLSINFKTPVNGYLSIYLLDDNVATAYCLLPYENEGGKARLIKSNVVSTLLSTKDPIYPYREETILTTKKDVEHNRLIFIFSTNEFTMPLTNSGEYVQELSTDNFYKWLHRNKVKDVDLQSRECVVEIRK